MREWSKLRRVARRKHWRSTILNQGRIHLVLAQSIDKVLGAERVAVHATHVHILEVVHVHRIHVQAIHVHISRWIRGCVGWRSRRQNWWHWQPVRRLWQWRKSK